MFANPLPDKTFFQICVIVDDLERYAENYRKILGFDVPSDIQITHTFDHTQATYHGKALNSRAKIVAWMMGQVMFELLQPIEEGSVWMDYLKDHGPGLHHTALRVPRAAPAAAYFIDHGYTVTQQGLFTDRTGMYIYLDTDKDLGITWELLEIYDPAILSDPGIISPSQPFLADKGLGTDVVIQVGLVVEDISATAKRYHDVLGVDATNQQETPGYSITEATFRGQPSEATAKLAFFDFGQAQLELIQPDKTPSVWRNYLNKYGDSAHHLAFRVQDTQQAVAHFAQHGIGIAQQGYYGDRSGVYTYMDSEAKLGIIIELLENFDRPR